MPPFPWRYLASCGLLLLPAALWNILLAGHLPPVFAATEFWRDIPAPLGIAENVLRTAVFALPFLMPLRISVPGSGRALAVFIAGTAVYFASWLPLILAPSSAWSASMAGFMAPAYTPLFWITGIALLGRRLFWGRFYRPWMYLAIGIAFLITHIWHTALVYGRN